jgi:hypothetical protein
VYDVLVRRTVKTLSGAAEPIQLLLGDPHERSYTETERIGTLIRRILAGRVEDWRGVPKVKPSLLLPVSVGSASIS